MEASTTPKPPGQQTTGFFDKAHDVELQSPIIESSVVNEKTTSYPLDSSDSPGETDRVSYLGAMGGPTPVRKYSREWWKRSWNGAVQHKVWPRFLYIAFGVIVIGSWIGTTIYFATDETSWNRGEGQQFERRRTSGEGASNDNTLISLSGSLKSFDPVARNLHIEWSGIFQENAEADPVPFGNGTTRNPRMPMDIYRDVSTVSYDFRYPGSNSTVPEDYWFRVDNITAPRIGTIGWHEWDSFDTDISFEQNAETANALTQPQYSYPYDEWKGQIVFVANVISLNQNESRLTVANQGTYPGALVFPLAGARLEDNSLNWRFDLRFDNPCNSSTATIMEYLKNATGNSDETIALSMKDDKYLSTVPVPCHLAITIVATRPPLVKFAAMMAMIVNWCSTIFIFVLTCETLIMRRGFMMSGTDLLGITFTALFALPSVRLLLPGAPEFGILIDLVGIIPNVLIISICISAIAITKLNRHRHAGQKDD